MSLRATTIAHLVGISRVPGIFGHSNLFHRVFVRKGWTRRLDFDVGRSGHDSVWVASDGFRVVERVQVLWKWTDPPELRGKRRTQSKHLCK